MPHAQRRRKAIALMNPIVKMNGRNLNLPRGRRDGF
jgi:hypothetical protein